MSVWITGDCHGDFQRFTLEGFPQQKGMGRDDYMIICGDHGGVWAGERADGYKLDWLENRPFTTLFVDGNHENFDLLNAYPEKEWHGGRVHEIRPHVLHLMRGQIFDIGGSTWFAMGGAASHDIQDGILDPALPDFERRYWVLRRMNARFRVLGYSWWPEEMPSGAEYAEAEAIWNGWAGGWIISSPTVPPPASCRGSTGATVRTRSPIFWRRCASGAGFPPGTWGTTTGRWRWNRSISPGGSGYRRSDKWKNPGFP